MARKLSPSPNSFSTTTRKDCFANCKRTDISPLLCSGASPYFLTGTAFARNAQHLPDLDPTILELQSCITQMPTTAPCTSNVGERFERHRPWASGSCGSFGWGVDEFSRVFSSWIMFRFQGHDETEGGPCNLGCSVENASFLGSPCRRPPVLGDQRLLEVSSIEANKSDKPGVQSGKPPHTRKRLSPPLVTGLRRKMGKLDR